MLDDVIGRLSETFFGDWIGEVLRYFAVPVLPVARLVFIYQYYGKKINPHRIKWLLIIPVISWLVMLTNPLHHLFFTDLEVGRQSVMKVEYGMYFWFVHLPYCYGLMVVIFFTVAMEFSRAARHYRKQIALLFVSLCIPFVVNILVTLKVIGNLTPISFPVFFSIMAYAIFRHQFLGSNPIAYETVFHTIRDGVIILDRNDVIRDINPAAAKGLGKKRRKSLVFTSAMRLKRGNQPSNSMIKDLWNSAKLKFRCLAQRIICWLIRLRLQL